MSRLQANDRVEGISMHEGCQRAIIANSAQIRRKGLVSGVAARNFCAGLRTVCASALEPVLMMNSEIERNLGEQPIARIMQEHSLKPHDLVAISAVEMTHKMVSRACRGRRLTLNTQSKILAALNRATGKNYSLRDLFNY